MWRTLVAFLAAVKAYSLLPLVQKTDVIVQKDDGVVILTVDGTEYSFFRNYFNKNEYLVVTHDMFDAPKYRIDRAVLEATFRDEQQKLRKAAEEWLDGKRDEFRQQEEYERGTYYAYCLMFGMQPDDVADDRKGELDDYLMP